MIQSIMNILLMTLSFLFSQLKHPLTMGFLLLIQTTVICMITGLMNESFWFSYILFLVFLGGMLVLFIYITSLASNEMFNFSLKLMLLMSLFLTSMIIISMLMSNMELSFINNNEMFMTQSSMNYSENTKSIYKLYNFPTNWMTLMLINYLFFTLIVAVKITNFFSGPLRNLN